MQKYLPRVLSPDPALLSSVELEFWSPTDEYDALASAVRKIGEMSSLIEAAAEYYRRCGHLPLTGPLGMGEMVRAWLREHAPSEVLDSALAMG